jgi:hypothetical protein
VTGRERDEREREKRTFLSTTSKASIVYIVYNTAVDIVVHGKKCRGEANTTSADCMKLQRDEVKDEETEQIPYERL